MQNISQEKVNANSNKSVQDDGWWQPLLFAPDELLRGGMQDAHSYPLVGTRGRDGVISWRESPSSAWSRELIEMARTGNSHAAIIFDCDSRASVEIAASACVGTGPVPPPNFASARKASGHFQCGWFLRDPVHRGAAQRKGRASAPTEAKEYGHSPSKGGASGLHGSLPQRMRARASIRLAVGLCSMRGIHRKGVNDER